MADWTESGWGCANGGHTYKVSRRAKQIWAAGMRVNRREVEATITAVLSVRNAGERPYSAFSVELVYEEQLETDTLKKHSVNHYDTLTEALEAAEQFIEDRKAEAK